MRHRVYGKHLGRNSNQRNALFKGLVRSLFLHESITTTETKAKAVKGLIDKLVAKGKDGKPQSKRFIQGFLPDAEVNRKLLEEIAPRFSTRTSGFTSLVKLGRRVGDGAMIVKMSLMEGEMVKGSNGPKEPKEPEAEKAVNKEEKMEVKKTVKTNKITKKAIKKEKK